VPRRSTGIGLDRLFIGGEGCFGVITEATLRVFPMPEQRILQAYAFPDFAVGLDAVMEAFRIGLQPSILDYGEGGINAEYDYPVLYLAFEGVNGVVEAQAQRAEAICASHGGRKLDGDEAQGYWDGRHRVAERFTHGRVGKLGDSLDSVPSDRRFDYVHVCLPAGKVLEYCEASHNIAERYGLDIVDYGLWCQPELYSTVIVRSSVAGQGAVDAAGQAVDEMLTLAQEIGGSMEYCHGVGLRLAHLMREEHGEVGLEVLRTLKRALDPQNILNPGKLDL
jgi:FAD/FMN-containing dehydrogenase